MRCVFFCSVNSEEGCEVLLGPEVTYGPPGLDLDSPLAMTIAHCCEVNPDHWNIQLRRKTAENKWEVRQAPTSSLSSAIMETIESV